MDSSTSKKGIDICEEDIRTAELEEHILKYHEEEDNRATSGKER